MAESMAEVRPSPQQSPRQPSRTSTLATLETVAQARSELEARLTGIHDDLQLTQTIGLLFVKRQEDLKTCFDQLQQLNAQEQSLTDNEEAGKLPESFREQLAQLDRDFQEGQNGIAGLKGLIDAQLVSSLFSASACVCVWVRARDGVGEWVERWLQGR